MSLDGRKEIHDRYRVDYAGKGSWERIVPKFQKLVEARGGKDYYMRGTFTHANPDFLKDVQTMLDLGFRELSMEPVVSGADDPSALTKEDMEIVMDQYEKLAELMLKHDKENDPFTFYHYMIDLTGGPCIYKRISGCGSGTEYMAVTPWGDLYPCHQFVGDEKFKLGDVWKGVTNHQIQDKFALPNTPKYICDVELEAGTHMRIGIANSLPDWGTGGGIQYDLMGQRIGIFKNERLIGDGKNV